MEPYYQDELVTLYRGDCEELLPQMPKVDLIFTSPPYNLGTTSGGGFGHYGPNAPMDKRGGGGKWHGAELANGYADHDDAMPTPKYEEWQRRILNACWVKLEEMGAIFYNHKPRVQSMELWTPLRLNPDLPIRQIIVWARAGGINFSPTHYVPTHEWIIIFAKPGFRLKNRGASGVGDVWRMPAESNNPHPAPFPVGLPATAIETVGPSLVLDPFAGSGTTLVAAKAAGVRSIGIEKSERYCEMAVRRLAQGSLFAQGVA